MISIVRAKDLDAAIEKSGGSLVPPESQLESINEVP